MNWIVWDKTLETGHPWIDEDHKELARLFNLLPEAKGMPRGKELCSNVLGQIIAHAGTHFDQEQQLMAKHKYPKMAQHSAEHAMLLEQALNYRIEFDASAGEPDVALVDFPEVWLSFHILFSDKDLARFLSQTT
jgi:hemerythrin-like metal-binding protein